MEMSKSHQSTTPIYLWSVILVGFLIVTLSSHLFAQDADQKDSNQKIEHVIVIGADANGAKYLEKFLKESPEEFKNFKRLIDEGATTLNARTDYFVTITQPNVTCIITGYPSEDLFNVKGVLGHNWKKNYQFPEGDSPASLQAVNSQKGYTSSMFDVAHDEGLKTGLYWGSGPMFRYISTSFGPEFGSEHKNGRNKIDYPVGTNSDENRIKALAKDKANLSMIYFWGADKAGHRYGYLGKEYRNAVKAVDGYIGKILEFVESDPGWKDKTAIIYVADHGGKPGTKSHSDKLDPHVYTVPLFVWGPGVAKGADLYQLNTTTRKDPGSDRPEYGLADQPIRNGDVSNLALKLLGLPPIPGSSINQKQDLAVQ